MKRKISLLVFLVGMFFTAFAQKQYVTVTASDMYWSRQSIYLTGDIPSGINSYYESSGHYDEFNLECPTVGKLLNLLAKDGFTVEQMANTGGSNIVTYLLSKNSAPSENGIEVINNDDSEAVEVARYNLQGIPVNENEKGVQIIVYSNYTTKTVVVQ